MTPRRRPVAGGADLTVVRADADDLDILSLVIAEAFTDLPPSRWLIPLAAARREIFPGYFRLVLEHALASGTVHTTPGRTAAALWLPRGMGAAAGDYDERLAAATQPWTTRFEAFDAALEHRHPAGPHQYLAILAVRPDRQRLGTGTALLRARHDILDRDPGTAAYLEASSPRARRLYLAHGYADHGPPIELPGGTPMYPMMRLPPACLGEKELVMMFARRRREWVLTAAGIITGGQPRGVRVRTVTDVLRLLGGHDPGTGRSSPVRAARLPRDSALAVQKNTVLRV